MDNPTTTWQQETLFTAAHPDIVVCKDYLSTFKAFGLFILSFLLLSGSYLLQESRLTLCLLLLVTGVGAACYALYLLWGCSKRKVYRPTGSEVKEKRLFFNKETKHGLMACVESGSFHNLLPMKTYAGGSIRLDLLLSADGKFAAAQVMEFEPYSFVPTSPMFYYTDRTAGELSAFVREAEK